MKITNLVVEGVKRVKAVQMTLTPNGLNVIGGKNAQGKTSILDAIAWALGGAKFRPSNPTHEASRKAVVRVELDNGMIAERSGKNGTLKVYCEDGSKGGQAILDELISQIALNIQAFVNASGKDKAKTLLGIIGVGEELQRLEEKEKELYDERTAVGREWKRKEKHAEDLPFVEDAPAEEISVRELLERHTVILGENAENRKKRERVKEYERLHEQSMKDVARLSKELDDATKNMLQLGTELESARMTAEELVDVSTEKIESDIRDVEAINKNVRINKTKMEANKAAAAHKREYDGLTLQLESIRDERLALLDGADMPLPELTIEDAELVYRGQKWDCMSSAEQLKVATAIGHAVRPSCQFILLDKTEQMDVDTLRDFGEWAASLGMQIIATRVSTGDECSVIIEDGMIAGENQGAGPHVKEEDETPTEKRDESESPKWKIPEPPRDYATEPNKLF